MTSYLGVGVGNVILLWSQVFRVVVGGGGIGEKGQEERERERERE